MPRSAVALALSVALLGCSSASSSSKNPTINGKTVREWTKSLSSGGFGAMAASMALSKTPPAAIPTLIEGFDDAPAFSMHDSGLGRPGMRLQILVAHLGPVALQPARDGLKSPSAKVRAGSARTLGEMGAAAGVAVAEIAPLLKAAAPDERRAAAEALGQIGAASNSRAGDLTAAAKDPDGLVRHAAMYALGSVGPLPIEACELLVSRAMDHRAMDCAMDSIRRSGANMKAILPRLLEAQRSGTPVPMSAVILPAMGDAVLPEYLRWLASDDAGTRSFGAQSIGQMREGGAKAAPELMRALQDPDPLAAESASNALVYIGADYRAAKDLLKSQLFSPGGPCTSYALSRLGPDGIQVIAEALASADPAVRRRGLGATFVSRGVDNAALAPSLRALAADPDPEVRVQVMAAFEALSMHAHAEAVAGLLDGLKDKAEPVRTAAGQILRQVDRDAAAKAGLK